MNTIIIEANARNQLIFALSVSQQEISLKKICKIILLIGSINKKKFYFLDIIKFLKFKGLEVIVSSRKNFFDHTKGTRVHSMYTYSFVPVALLKFKIMTFNSAYIIRYEEGLGTYSNWISQVRSLIDANFFYLALRAPLAIFLKNILNVISLTSDNFLLTKNNSINIKLKNSIIKTISEIHLFSPKKKVNFKVLACINSYEEFAKISKMNKLPNAILYKPHQRFFIKKFFTKKIKSKFYAGYLTAEELIFSNKILRVWAFESSVLVYGAVLFGITSYNIMNKNVIYCSRVKKILEKYTLTLN